jgi:hypothetical protein
LALLVKTSVIAALSLFTGLVSQASASLIIGDYSYTYTGSSADGTCSAGSRDSFSGPGSNTLNGTDTVSDAINFSACNNTPGGIVGGLFSINDGAGNTVTGFFSATADGTTTVNGNPNYGVEDGTYTVLTASGRYAGVYDGTFTAQTGPVGGILQGTGDLELESVAPEPATLVLSGAGLLLAGLLRRRRQNA